MVRGENGRKVQIGISIGSDVSDRLNSVVESLKRYDKDMNRSKFLDWLLRHVLTDKGVKKVVDLYLRSQKRS